MGWGVLPPAVRSRADEALELDEDRRNRYTTLAPPSARYSSSMEAFRSRLRTLA